MKSVTVFRNRHRGQDIYVLGAAASLDLIDPSFFAGRIVITVNEVAQTKGIVPNFVVLKEHRESLLLAAATYPETPMIVSRHSYGDPNRGFPTIDRTPMIELPNVYVFEHEANRSLEADPVLPADPDSLVVSASTITSAMHFAAYLGAGTIFVAGHDGGQLGESPYMAGYGVAEKALGYGVQKLDWLLAIMGQSRAVKRQLVERYGCRLYGLSPFISLDLEGAQLRMA